MAYMGVIMNLKSRFPDEGLLTAWPLTLEGSSLRVHLHVGLEVALCVESLLTLVAFEWPPSFFLLLCDVTI